MDHGNLLFLNFSSEFVADLQAGARLGQRAVLKDPAYMVESEGDCQHDGGAAILGYGKKVSNSRAIHPTCCQHSFLEDPFCGVLFKRDKERRSCRKPLA